VTDLWYCEHPLRGDQALAVRSPVAVVFVRGRPGDLAGLAIGHRKGGDLIPAIAVIDVEDFPPVAGKRAGVGEQAVDGRQLLALASVGRDEP